MNTTLTYHSPEYLADTRVTIVGNVTEENEKIKLSFGASRCSEKDQFNKKKGRSIASLRAEDESKRIMELTINNNNYHFKQLVDLFRTTSSALSIIIIEDSRKVKK
ncbi:MAG: hypothetical protein M0R17_08540 [Candidatus Omnitrophica bacterium]|jgi:hypothetical protein|nr:hypothetical protein [Candidatus Omnitrophota bacterium]